MRGRGGRKTGGVERKGNTKDTKDRQEVKNRGRKKEILPILVRKVVVGVFPATAIPNRLLRCHGNFCHSEQSAGCWLCRIAREARGESTDSLVDETHGHIHSAGCEGMATTVTAAHHSIWRYLYDSMHAAQESKSKLKFVTLD